MSVNGQGQNGDAVVASEDFSTYDRVRAENTANDAPEDELGSGSASCNLPGQDYPKKAYEQLKQFRGEPDGEDEDGENGNMVRLIGIDLPKNRKVEELVDAD